MKRILGWAMEKPSRMLGGFVLTMVLLWTCILIALANVWPDISDFLVANGVKGLHK